MTSSINWAWVPVALLGSLATGLALMISIAVNDPGFAVEPGYYQHALNWDAHRAEVARSAALGWSARWELTARTSARAATPASVRVRVSLSDANGVPLDADEVRVSAFANARAADVQTLTFRQESPGVFGADLSVARPGVWHLECLALRAADRFVQRVSLEFTRDGQPIASSLRVIEAPPGNAEGSP